MIEIRNLEKKYRMGEHTVYALRGVSLTIAEGEFVAIMGPSGSGKSTLMHILGLLDTPDTGSYLLHGREVASLSEDELAVLRREEVGFVFQQFNLLPRMSAQENASLPLLYSEGKMDIDRGRAVLERVNLGSRLFHKTNELSGGQQQRVAIGRALINNPRIILADEPTGNLDSESEKEIMSTLQELNSQGITVIIVTHEEEIAAQARRRIRIRDGLIQSDERTAPASATNTPQKRKTRGPVVHKIPFEGTWEYFVQGFKTLLSNRVRTILSMLGILIGVAAVVAMLALGSGAQKAIEAQLSSLGSNMLMLRPGAIRAGGVAQEAGTTTRLTLEDAQTLRAELSSVNRVAPSVHGRGQVTFQNRNWNTMIRGSSSSYAKMRSSEPEVGRFFTDDEDRKRARVAVIGATIVRELFGEHNPVGEMIKINKVGFLVIGVLPEKGATGWQDQDDVIMVPVSTAMYRLLGRTYVDTIDIEVKTAGEMEATQRSIVEVMAKRHRIPPSQGEDAYQVRNMADIQAAVTESSRTMGLLLASIAAISLLVGGIGIMNIMLVSVTERTREIGLRKAVGARSWDILSQFLAESVVVSVVGGLLGIALGWLITVSLAAFAGWTTSISPGSVLLAFFFSATIGVVFGIYPARKASLLHPIEALRYE